MSDETPASPVSSKTSPESTAKTALVPLSPEARAWSGVVAVLAAVGLVAYIVVQRPIKQALTACTGAKDSTCVVEVTAAPDAAISIGLLAIALIFALFAITGFVWSIKAGLLESQLATTDKAEVVAPTSPEVKEAISVALEKKNKKRVAVVGKENVEALDPTNSTFVFPTAEQIKQIVPEGLWEAAVVKWRENYPGSSLLDRVENVKVKTVTSSSPGYYVLEAKSPDDNPVALKLSRN